MTLTPFGKALRKARIDSGDSLNQMAEALGVTAPFLSAVETGKKKVPAQLAERAADYFAAKDVAVDGLEVLADVANESVSLAGLSQTHQLLVAKLARAKLDEARLDRLVEIMRERNDAK